MSKPVLTLRDGKLSASIWENTGESGKFYSVTFQRVYTDKDSGEVKNSSAFSGAEILQIAQLATKAYNEVGEMRNSS